jgi:hypothetical protein
MEKRGEKNQQKRPSKKKQYERFAETARNLGIDNEQSAEAFERAFRKIVPSKSRPPPRS